MGGCFQPPAAPALRAPSASRSMASSSALCRRTSTCGQRRRAALSGQDQRAQLGADHAAASALPPKRGRPTRTRQRWEGEGEAQPGLHPALAPLPDQPLFRIILGFENAWRPAPRLAGSAGGDPEGPLPAILPARDPPAGSSLACCGWNSCFYPGGGELAPCKS